MVKKIFQDEKKIKKSKKYVKKILTKEMICEALKHIKSYFLGVVRIFYLCRRKIHYRWDKVDVELFFEALEHLVIGKTTVVRNQLFFFMKNKKRDGCKEMVFKFVDNLLERNNYEMHLYLIYFYLNGGEVYDGTELIKNQEDFWNFLSTKEYSVFYVLSIIGVLL